MAETVTTINRPAPYVETYGQNLMGAVQGLINQRLGQGGNAMLPPNYQVANMSGLEQLGGALAEHGVGSFAPYLQQGAQTIQNAASNITGAATPYMMDAAGLYHDSNVAGTGAAVAGIGGLAGTGAQFDPNQIPPHMNPYETQVIDQMTNDVERARQIQHNQIGANAVGAGAFGGSRHGLVEAENNRNALESVARNASNIRQTGYESAAGRAQTAFEQAQQRRMQGANLTGQLGMSAAQLTQGAAGGLGGLGSQLGNLSGMQGQLGMQQAGIGELMSSLGTRDINTLMQVGGLQRNVQQAGLDANRQNIYNQQMQPFQLYGYMSDILQGVPSAQSQVQASAAAQPSAFQQAAGLGIGAVSLANGAQQLGGIF